MTGRETSRVTEGPTPRSARGGEDMAAGVIIAREAGAKVTDQDGSDHASTSAATVATTPALADDIRSLISTTSEAQSRS
ncbi:hypothetical protein [Spirillospora sp. NPDC048823]|uniref:hypothetical protein n=1 Tax=unclassified Spirillospora TaxID=2642701 RepID=UPI003720BAD6